MEMKLTFAGAARNVTGSCYVVETDGRRVLVDCGMYQERDLKERNFQPFPFTPSKVDAVVLTHAHLDHCGRLPKLVRDGFRGPIYGTPATVEIAAIVMADSARIQQEDAKFKKRRHEREGRESPHGYEPLYRVEDAEAAIGQLRPVPYGTVHGLGGGMSAEFHDMGHILGSSSVSLVAGQDAARRRVVFSGDVGRWDRPILNDPVLVGEGDYVVVESTYGDRVHEPVTGLADELTAVVNDTVERGGNLVIPSFAIERTHELLYLLNELLMADRIPHLMVFVDSPMAVEVTRVFQRHPENFDAAMRKLCGTSHSPFRFPTLKLSESVEDSKAINRIKGSAIIIAGSGMCTGGRIKHHLEHNVDRKESTILFVGYQAAGTLGRVLSGGAPEIRVNGVRKTVKARIAQLHGFSGHADRDELLRWLGGFSKAPRRCFVTHGEETSALAFGDLVREKLGWTTTVPAFGEVADLG